ncbi:SSI family serine proteinase inhibitor [Microlunatus soli]|uniref:Subtilisin inhibitor-like n=1 Tax=Microlunatus soli TaxID=630515 RepID=A0A1H1NIK2_9ACTN|nr:SSI family serine proteinase inhibitor [Microlunatus soli]SDR98891.1 Subtilisin inhibitor-like [Microlunatus soli]
MFRLVLLLTGGLLAVGLSGCGGDRDELTIRYDDGAGTTSDWTLTCNPPGGSHPDPEAACQALEKNGSTALPPVPKDKACTMIFGGPQTATITGTWHGDKVDSSLSRTNGCEIARWKALAGLLPEQ